MSRYQIKITRGIEYLDGMFLDISFIIPDVILEGEYSDLIENMKDVNFVNEIGIDNSFYFERFNLVRV